MKNILSMATKNAVVDKRIKLSFSSAIISKFFQFFFLVGYVYSFPSDSCNWNCNCIITIIIMTTLWCLLLNACVSVVVVVLHSGDNNTSSLVRSRKSFSTAKKSLYISYLCTNKMWLPYPNLLPRKCVIRSWLAGAMLVHWKLKNPLVHVTQTENNPHNKIHYAISKRTKVSKWAHAIQWALSVRRVYDMRVAWTNPFICRINFRRAHT